MASPMRERRAWLTWEDESEEAPPLEPASAAIKNDAPEKLAPITANEDRVDPQHEKRSAETLVGRTWRARRQELLAALTPRLRSVGCGAIRIEARLHEHARAFAARGASLLALEKSRALVRSSRKALLNARAWAEARAPMLRARLARTAAEASRYARAMTPGAWSSFEWAKAPKVADLGRSPMVAGALLLLCGALLFAGGFLLRADAPSEPSRPVAWSFETAGQPIERRMVFTFAGTPAAYRISGLSIRAENTLDQPLTAVEGAIKPDAQEAELELTLAADTPAIMSTGASTVEVLVAPAIAGDGVPPRAPFKLVHTFSGDGLSPEQFFAAYGGLTLNVRYAVEGKQRVFIKYFSPETLRAQLADVQGAGY